jgi:hypothetical protein
VRRNAIIVGGAVAAITLLFVIRALVAKPPLAKLRHANGTYAGQWWFPRGGPYILGFEAPDLADLAIDGKIVAAGKGVQSARVIFDAGAHQVALHAPAGTRLLWHPPGRRGTLEYVPASSLSPDGNFGAGRGADLLDALILTLAALFAAAALLLVWRPRLDRLAGGVFLLALALRVAGIGAQGQTWDEDEYWSAGRNYATNIASLDFHESSWQWNFQHPPVTKYIAGLGSLWADGYGPARFLFALFSAATCALVFAIGRKLFGARAGVIAGAVAALLPPLLAHASIVGHETPSVFFWTLAIWLALDANKPARLAAVGVACGLAVGTRFSNVFLAFPVVACLVDPRDWRRAGLAAAIVPAAALVTFVAIWPLMWSSPLRHLHDAWHILKQQHLPENYLGHMVQTPPWHYFPVYVLASTPLLVLAAMLPGVRPTRAWLILGVWLLAPFGVAWSPVRQDGVRYVLPIFVPMALAAGAGVASIKHERISTALGFALAAYLAVTCVVARPYYLDYYQELASPKSFETGWWGEGLNEAVDYVNSHAADGASVARLAEPVHVTWFRGDLWAHLTDRASALTDWIVVNGEWIENHGGGSYTPPPGFEEKYVVKAGRTRIATVYGKP